MRPCEIKTPIPQLDLRRFDAGDKQRAAFLAELRAAAHEVGFFYITGHDVETQLLRDLLRSARRFFSLPDGDKRAIEMVNSPHFRGYNRVASERTRGQPDWREQIDIGAERPAIPRGGSSPVWERLRGPNQWPGRCPSCRPWSRAGKPPPCGYWYEFCVPSRWRLANPATRSNPCMAMIPTI
jgi:isopenicillin N synthase-like dioxygenase